MSDDKVAAYLAEIEQREQAATCGPWALETDQDWDDERTWTYPYGIRMPEPHTTRADRSHRDFDYLYSELREMTMPTAEFLVAARSDVPRLLAAVRAGLELAARWADVGPAPRPADEVQRRACAAELRAAITKALLEEEGI